MKSTTLLMFLFAKSFHSFVIALPCDKLSNLRLVENYKSPQLYTFGGVDDSGKLQSSASNFNSSTGKWKKTTDMAVTKHTSCGAAVGSKIYLFGGWNGQPLRTAEVYDCETGTYSQFRSMQDARAECAAAVLGDYIYVSGGYNAVDRYSSMIRYNIHTTREEDVRSMNIVRWGHQLIELRGRLYAIGGFTKIVEMYDSNTDRWSTVAATQNAHTWFGATAHEGRIYVCSQLGCEMYSPDINQWTTFASPNNYKGITLVSMNRKLWAIGGGISNTPGEAAFRSVFSYDTFAEKWYQEPDMDVPRVHHTAFVVNH